MNKNKITPQIFVHRTSLLKTFLYSPSPPGQQAVHHLKSATPLTTKLRQPLTPYYMYYRMICPYYTIYSLNQTGLYRLLTLLYFPFNLRGPLFSFLLMMCTLQLNLGIMCRVSKGYCQHLFTLHKRFVSVKNPLKYLLLNRFKEDRAISNICFLKENGKPDTQAKQANPGIPLTQSTLH